MKTCRVCKVEKPLDDYYAQPKAACGRDSKCKECAKQMIHAARIRNLDHYKAYDKARANKPERAAARAAYIKTEAGRRSHDKANRKYFDAHPNRYAAGIALSRAVRDGTLIKQPCFVCGETVVEGHHPDYDKPLAVVWLCVKHHKQLHREHKQELNK